MKNIPFCTCRPFGKLFNQFSTYLSAFLKLAAVQQTIALMTPFNRRFSTFLYPPTVLSHVLQEEHWTCENKLCALIIRDSEGRLAQLERIKL